MANMEWDQKMWPRPSPNPQSAASAIERGIDARTYCVVDQVGLARADRLPVEGEAEDQDDEAGGGGEGDGQRHVGPPGRERVVAPIHDGELAVPGAGNCARQRRPALHPAA